MSEPDDLEEEGLSDEIKELDLTMKQKVGIPKFFRGVAEGKDLQEIADDIGVSRKTLWEWRQQEEFLDGIKAVYDQGMVELLPLVVKTLREHLEGEKSSRDVDIAKTVMKAAGVHEDEKQQAPQPIKIERKEEKQED